MINTFSFADKVEEQIDFILNMKKRYSDEDVTNILLRFHQYILSHPTILVQDIDFSHLKDRLNSLYDRRRKDLYRKHYSLCKRVCSFCGRDAGDTLDHFYPKVKFPEFSIFLNNLVPCCSDCNTLKDDNVIGEDIYLIHPFYVDAHKKIMYKLNLKNVVLVNGIYIPDLELNIDDSDMTNEQLLLAYETLHLMKIQNKIIRRCIDCIRNHLKDPNEMQKLINSHGSLGEVAMHFSNNAKTRLETLTVLDFLALEMLGNAKNLKLFLNSK